MLRNATQIWLRELMTTTPPTEAALKRVHMSPRSKTMLIYVLLAVVVAGAVVYFQHHQFHWWLLIGPAIGTPLAIIASRRQKHWDDLRSRRESSDGL